MFANVLLFHLFPIAKTQGRRVARTEAHKSSRAPRTRGVTQGSVIILTVHVGLRLPTAKGRTHFQKATHGNKLERRRKSSGRRNEANANRQASRHQSVLSRRDQSRARLSWQRAPRARNLRVAKRPSEAGGGVM